MSKECTPIGGATGSILNEPCIESALGRCNGRYELAFGFNRTVDPVTQVVSNGGITRAFLWDITLSATDKYIRGPITCVTEPLRRQDGSWICLVRSTNPNRAGLENFNAVTITPPEQRLSLTVTFLGLVYVDDDFCALDSSCVCTGGDQQIDCAGAQGGICCVPRPLIDGLCDRLN